MTHLQHLQHRQQHHHQYRHQGHGRLLPTRILPSGVFPSPPVSSYAAAGGSYRLPAAGKCPKEQPTLTILIFDDSASVGLIGGTDPIGNRYQEAATAVTHVAKKCRCKGCLAAVVHFDTPTSTDVASHPLRDTTTLETGLQPPDSFAGISTLGPSLDVGLQIAEDHPDHQVALVVFSDFWLTDSDEIPARLASFPGKVFPVILGDHQALELAEAGLEPINIGPSEVPGAVAKALFQGLTAFRVGVR